MGRHRRSNRSQKPIRSAPTEAVHAPAPPAIRLVRSEGEDLSSEPISAGLSGAPVSGDILNGGREQSAAAEEGEHILVAASSAHRAVELRRSFDPADINPILNDPSVFRFVGAAGIEQIDAAPILRDQRNILLMADGGGILFCWHEPFCYEVHTNFLRPDKPSLAHGLYVLKCSLAAYRWMFTRTNCAMLITRIPKHNSAALRLAPLAGWVTEFERKAVWPSVDAGMVDMAYCAIHYDDWIRRTVDLRQSGKKFHADLSSEFERHGRDEEQHPDDDAHDLHVGACAEMIAGGQIEKAIVLYNRWARFAGYGQIELVSVAQRLIDIGNSLIQITDGGGIKVLLLR